MAANPDFYLSSTVALALLSLYTTHHYIQLTTTPPPPNPSHRNLHGLYSIQNTTSFASPIVLKPVEEKKAPPLQEPSAGHAEQRLRWPPPPATSGVASTNDVGRGRKKDRKGVFHDEQFFAEDYAEMNRSFKIYVYPHSRSDRFARAVLPTTGCKFGANFASEAYFKKILVESHFVTKDPSEAHLFFLPFSITALRYDRAVGVSGIPKFIREYVSDARARYPYWNRSGGADHFYVACHSVGRSAASMAPEVRSNTIQVVCSSSYHLAGYVPHKDASIPQIWPRKGPLPYAPPKTRGKLAFYAGTMNSRIRRSLIDHWGKDKEISVHDRRLSTPYVESLLSSKFCLHARGFEVNTARVADAIFYGCVPVILADYYDLPFTDILDWTTFSIVVPSPDIPNLKKILQNKVKSGEYETMFRNVLKVRKHFRWSAPPKDRDVFYMVMYELWLRRSVVRFHV